MRQEDGLPPSSAGNVQRAPAGDDLSGSMAAPRQYMSHQDPEPCLSSSPGEDSQQEPPPPWDQELHVPLWVSANEARQVEARLESWVDDLLACVGKDRIRGVAQV